MEPLLYLVPALIGAIVTIVGFLLALSQLRRHKLEIEESRDFTKRRWEDSNMTLEKSNRILALLLRTDLDLRNLLGSSHLDVGRADPAVLAYAMVRRILSHAQEMFRNIWLGATVVVTLKSSDPDDSSSLRSYYADSDPSRDPEHRLDGLGELGPPRIPRRGTLAGHVLESGKAVFIRSISELDAAGPLSHDEIQALDKYSIRSIAGWPIRFRKETVAVLVVDSDSEGSIEKTEFVELLMNVIATRISFVFELARRDSAALSEPREQRKSGLFD